MVAKFSTLLNKAQWVWYDTERLNDKTNFLSALVSHKHDRSVVPDRTIRPVIFSVI